MKHRPARTTIINETHLTHDDREALRRKEAYNRGEVYIPQEYDEVLTPAVAEGRPTRAPALTGEEPLFCKREDWGPKSETCSRYRALTNVGGEGMCQGACLAQVYARR